MSQTPLTDFDQMTIPPQLQLIKALLPYMEYSLQESLSFIIRTYELIYTANYYNNPANLRLAACSSKPHISLTSPLNDILNDSEIIKAILPYCSENIQQILSTYSNANEFKCNFNNKYNEYTDRLNKLNI